MKSSVIAPNAVEHGNYLVACEVDPRDGQTCLVLWESASGAWLGTFYTSNALSSVLRTMQHLDARKSG